MKILQLDLLGLLSERLTYKRFENRVKNHDRENI